MLRFILTTLPFLRDKCTWVHRSLGFIGINEYTERKVDCFQPSWLHTPSVTRPSSPSLLCLHHALLLIFFSPTPQKHPILEWPSEETLTMTLLVVEYTWKCTVQRDDFCLEVGIYTVLSSLGGLRSRNGAVWHLMGVPHLSAVNLFLQRQKKEEGTQLIILCGAICLFISWCIPWLVENHSWQTQNLPYCQKVHL